MKIISYLILFAVIALIIGLSLLPRALTRFLPSTTITAIAEHEFSLNVTLDDLRRVLLTQDVTDKIIEANGNILLSKSVSSGSIHISRLFRPKYWGGERTELLQVQFTSKYLGEAVMDLKSESTASYDGIQSYTSMRRCSSSTIKNYVHDLRFVRSGNQTVVKMENSITINSRMPPRMKPEIEQNLYQTIAEEQTTAQRVITDLANRYSGTRNIPWRQ